MVRYCFHSKPIITIITLIIPTHRTVCSFSLLLEQACSFSLLLSALRPQSVSIVTSYTDNAAKAHHSKFSSNPKGFRVAPVTRQTQISKTMTRKRAFFWLNATKSPLGQIWTNFKVILPQFEADDNEAAQIHEHETNQRTRCHAKSASHHWKQQQGNKNK